MRAGRPQQGAGSLDQLSSNRGADNQKSSGPGWAQPLVV